MPSDPLAGSIGYEVAEIMQVVQPEIVRRESIPIRCGLELARFVQKSECLGAQELRLVSGAHAPHTRWFPERSRTRIQPGAIDVPPQPGVYLHRLQVPNGVKVLGCLHDITTPRITVVETCLCVNFAHSFCLLTPLTLCVNNHFND